MNLVIVLTKVFFHHPFEVMSQIAVYEEDIEIALVVGEEDV